MGKKSRGHNLLLLITSYKFTLYISCWWRRRKWMDSCCNVSYL